MSIKSWRKNRIRESLLFLIEFFSMNEVREVFEELMIGHDSSRAVPTAMDHLSGINAEFDRFEAERARSIEWLRGLAAPNWDSTHRHPKLGPMRAGDIMAAWAAHDALHLRQLAKRLYELTRRDADTFGTAYAGDWTA